MVFSISHTLNNFRFGLRPEIAILIIDLRARLLRGYYNAYAKIVPNMAAATVVSASPSTLDRDIKLIRFYPDHQSVATAAANQ